MNWIYIFFYLYLYNISFGVLFYFGNEIVKEQVLEAFNKFDSDGSGCIDRDELSAVLKERSSQCEVKSEESLSDVQ